MRWILAGGVVGLAAVVIGLAVMLSGGGAGAARATGRDYDRSTPDAVLESVLLMVQAGDAHRLPELIYAESDEMRGVLNRLGNLLGSLQTLAAEIQNRFPQEAAELRARTIEQGAGRLAAAFGMDSPRRGRSDSPDGQRDRSDPQGLQTVLANPFAWLEAGHDRLSTIKTGDGFAAIMVDGKPAFGLGLMMRDTDRGWAVVAPLNLPLIRKYVPANRDEWSILASMLQVVDSAIAELAADVRNGKCRDVEHVSELAGEKAWMPLVMCVLAYNRAMEVREEAAAR